MEQTEGRIEQREEELGIEEWTLNALGYSHCLDVAVTDDSTVLGRNFLDAYGESPHRQKTEDRLDGFRDMDASDPDYEDSKAYILRFLKAKFGPPGQDNGAV